MNFAYGPADPQTPNHLLLH